MKQSTSTLGMSLIEIIIAAGIFSIVAVISLSSINVFSGADSKTKAKREAITAYQDLYQIISREIWAAKRIGNISDNKVTYLDKNNQQQELSYAGKKITLGGKKITPDNVEIESNNLFSGATSSNNQNQQPHLKVNISKVVVKNIKSNTTSDELSGDLSFAKILRIQ